MWKQFKLFDNRLLSICACVIGYSSSLSHAADSKSLVHGSGCVEPGVETTCLIVHDLKTGDNFNLFFNAAPPKVDSAISFEGTIDNNPNICMQGKPIDVTKWGPIRIHCPQIGPSNNVVTTLGGSKAPCNAWSAWYNVQPVEPKALHVAGICTFPP